MKLEQKGNTHGFHQQNRALRFSQLFGFLVLTPLQIFSCWSFIIKLSFSECSPTHTHTHHGIQWRTILKGTASEVIFWENENSLARLHKKARWVTQIFPKTSQMFPSCFRYLLVHIFFLLNYIYLFLCECVMCDTQKCSTCGSQFSPLTMRIPRTELRSSGLAAGLLLSKPSISRRFLSFPQTEFLQWTETLNRSLFSKAKQVLQREFRVNCLKLDGSILSSKLRV